MSESLFLQKKNYINYHNFFFCKVSLKYILKNHGFMFFQRVFNKYVYVIYTLMMQKRNILL